MIKEAYIQNWTNSTRNKGKIRKKPKGRDVFAGAKGKSKRSNVRDFGKKQNLPKRQKWQIVPAMGAIRIV